MNWCNMLKQAPLMWTIVITNGTSKWFLALMNCNNMPHQVLLYWKIVITNGTFEWFLALMNWRSVSSQCFLLWTLVVTNGTLEWFLALMNRCNVLFQRRWIWKHCPTYLTLVTIFRLHFFRLIGFYHKGFFFRQIEDCVSDQCISNNWSSWKLSLKLMKIY